MKPKIVALIIVFVFLNMMIMLHVESKGAPVQLYDHWYLITVDEENVGYCHENINRAQEKYMFSNVCEIEVTYFLFTYKYKQMEQAVLSNEGLESFESRSIEGNDEASIVGTVFPDHVKLVMKDYKNVSRQLRIEKADFDTSSIEINLAGSNGWIAEGTEKTYRILSVETGEIIKTTVKPIGFKLVPYQNEQVKVQIVESFSKKNGKRENWLTRQGLLIHSTGSEMNLTLTDKEGVEKRIPKSLRNNLPDSK